MIPSQNLIDKICARISGGGLTSLETCQTTNALTILSNPVNSVSTFSALPDPLLYNGRMVYVNDENRYYYAVEYTWVKDFTSNIATVVSNVWSWGSNTYGRLGDNTTVDKSSPVSAVGGFTDWCQVDVGNSHSLAIRTNGTAWAWGNNSDGKLGDGTTASKSSPVSVVGGFTDWRQVSAGDLHNVGLRTNGTLWAWGYGIQGQLGDNTTVNKSSPVSVVGGFTDWCQVSVGSSFSLAVRTNGTAWAWGRNNFGTLGDNSDTTASKSSPVSVVGGFTDWCQVSAGLSHSLGLRANGTVWAWGTNTSGALGDYTNITSRSSPVSVVGGFTDWCQVSAGNNFSLAIRTNGTLWAWGANNQGRLGDGTTTNRSSPVSVVGGFTDWCQVSAGRCHSLGVKTNGTLWAWGYNSQGRLGEGTTLFGRSSPVSVVGGFTDWCQVSADTHSLAIRRLVKGL